MRAALSHSRAFAVCPLSLEHQQVQRLTADCCRYPRGAGEAICTSKTHNFARRKGKDEEYQTAKPGKLEKLLSPLEQLTVFLGAPAAQVVG